MNVVTNFRITAHGKWLGNVMMSSVVVASYMPVFQYLDVDLVK